MTFLPIVKPQKLISIIQRQGFVKNRQSGSHAIFVHHDGRWTSVPIHRRTIGKGLLRKILRDIKLSPEELRKLI